MKKFVFVLLTIALIIGAFLGGTMGISLFIPFIAEKINEVLAIILLFPSLLLLLYSPGLIAEYMRSLYKKKLPPIKQWRVFWRVPHFGRIMPQCWDEARFETYRPYVTSEGNQIPFVMMGESQKWMRILGKYYPVDLICGYNEKKNVLYAIDGSAIKLPRRALLSSYKEGIKAFFEDRGHNYESIPDGTKYAFENMICSRPEELYKMDFGKLRYRWEDWMARSSGGENRKHDIFEDVLSNKEITAIFKSIRNKRDNLGMYTNFEDYKNEYAVCNGINLLSKLKYPQNRDGIGFLFDCLNDVDEPYFMMAVDELMKFPHKTLKNELEVRAKTAYEEQDVLKMAGLMFLAKKLNYEIEYVKEIKEKAAEAESVLELGGVLSSNHANS